MSPKKVEQVYQRTAKRLQLPELFVQRLVEAYYAEQRQVMLEYKHPVVTLSGLGQFLVRPRMFYKRLEQVEILINKFASRRDPRGITIRKELEIRRDMYKFKVPLIKLFQINRFGHEDTTN